MRLAPAERERLWKGLERFVNCGDDLGDFQALGRAFPDFWPVEVWHYPKQDAKSLGEPPVLSELFRPRLPGALGDNPPNELQPTAADQPEPGEEADELHYLKWHPVCHQLFLFYRDALRDVWDRKQKPDPRYWNLPEFLLGLSDWNERARDEVRAEEFGFFSGLLPRPYTAWSKILAQFPTAAGGGPLSVGMLWPYGDFWLMPQNDFQRAFYLLFRQSWRARVCPRCRLFFVARKPKQIFCGTGCSAGSRLASKRKWWRAVGAKRRARKRQRRGKGIATRNRSQRSGR